MTKIAAMVTVAGAALALTPPAHAGVDAAEPKAVTSTTLVAGNPYTPEGVCGSGYHVIDSLPLKHQTLGTGGRVYLLYNNSNGYNCAVTIKGVAVGTYTKTEATILVFTGDKFTEYPDVKKYKYYAGPVRVKAAGKCVEVFGNTFSTTSSTSYAAIIPKGHCGS